MRTRDISGLALEVTKVNVHTVGSVGSRDGAGSFELPPLSGGQPTNCSTSDVPRIVWAPNPSATTPASMRKTVLRLRLLSEHATSWLSSPTSRLARGLFSACCQSMRPVGCCSDGTPRSRLEALASSVGLSRRDLVVSESVLTLCWSACPRCSWGPAGVQDRHRVLPRLKKRRNSRSVFGSAHFGGRAGRAGLSVSLSVCLSALSVCPACLSACLPA